VRAYLLGSLLAVLVVTGAFAQDVSIQRVSEEPLSGGVSFSTITFDPRSITGWVTAPSIEMKGRHGLEILNTSITDNIWLTGVSGSTARGVLYPRERMYINAASNNHIYVSANTAVTVQICETR
jgi:hypothetical protein